MCLEMRLSCVEELKVRDINGRSDSEIRDARREFISFPISVNDNASFDVVTSQGGRA